MRACNYAICILRWPLEPAEEVLVELDTTGSAAPVPFHKAVVLLLVRGRISVIFRIVVPMEPVPNHASKFDRYVAGSERLGMVSHRVKFQVAKFARSPVKREHY